MSRLEPAQPSALSIYPLFSNASFRALSTFFQLLSSCAGPHGKNHIIRNSSGGHMTITSSCSRLLAVMSISRSELKLVVSAFTGHLQQCGDCGLFMAHMCLQLTRTMLDLDVPHYTVSRVFQSFVSIITDYIKSDQCEVCVKADFSDIDVLLAYVRSILSSKSLLNVSSQELKSLSVTILNAFVKAIPSAPLQRYSSGVFVLAEENSPITKSRIVDGILLECPDLSQYSESGKISFNKYLTVENNEIEAPVNVILITCSMSGDVKDTVTGTFEASEKQFMDLEDSIVERMNYLCNEFERENVNIVLCQKVIHPKVKKLLRSRNMIAVDRLGFQMIPLLKDLTGCKPITSFLQTPVGVQKYVGKLSSVTAVENNTRYISLQNNASSVVTLVVCAEWEERLSELKHCVTTCLQGLESLSQEPKLLVGGGCWQMHCAFILKEKVLAALPKLCGDLSCNESVLRKLLAVFTSCLQRWCLTLKSDSEHLVFDPSSLHCWRVAKNVPEMFLNDTKCCCGLRALSSGQLNNLDIVCGESALYSMSGRGRKDCMTTNVKQVNGYEHAVLDNFKACVEAFHKGVLTAGLLLSIGTFVCDRN